MQTPTFPVTRMITIHKNLGGQNMFWNYIIIPNLVTETGEKQMNPDMAVYMSNT